MVGLGVVEIIIILALGILLVGGIAAVALILASSKKK